MNNNVFFSIIVPIYNTKEEYFKECIHSLLNIEYDDYEIVLIDDGSNVSTKKYLSKISNPKITIYHNENHGQFKSRIDGVSKSKGEYCLFVDSDDILDANALQKLNAILQNNKVDMVLFGCARFSKTIKNILYKESIFNDGIQNKDDILTSLFNFRINGVCLKCIKKDIAFIDDIYIDENLRENEDLCQSSIYVERSNSFFYTTNSIYYYRLNEDFREYYNINKVNRINFLISIYNTFFTKKEYEKFLPIFKTNSIKYLLSYSFDICKEKLTLSKKKELFYLLSSHKTITFLDETNCKINFIYNLCFFFIKNNFFIIIYILFSFYNFSTKFRQMIKSQ